MKSSKDVKGLKFEAALEQLELIVQEMENGELPLDRLIERYEEGTKLVKTCQEKLAEAEQKVEILTQAPASPAAEVAPAKKSNDEMRLF